MMGLENRDYYREGPGYSDQFGWNLDLVPPAVKFLIAANIVVFVLQIFFTRPLNEGDLLRLKERYPDLVARTTEQEESDPDRKDEKQPSGKKTPKPIPISDILGITRISIIQEWFQLDTRLVLRGQIWRLITCAFCHDRDSVFHILMNMLLFYWGGVQLERMYGTREFSLFYCAAAIFASFAYMGLELATGSNVPSLGASGAVMGVVMLYAIHFPRDQIRIFWYWPLEVRWVVLMYIVFDLYPVLMALSGEHVFTGVAHAAHLGGLAFGYLYYWRDLHLSGIWQRVTGRGGRAFRPRKRRTERPVETTELVDDVDDILRKLHAEGKESLTDAEQQALLKASERLQRRRRNNG